MEQSFNRLSMGRAPAASSSERVPADWSPMDDNMALVACGGKWVPATPDQLVVIRMGEEACACQQMFEPYRTEAVGDYEYVVGVGSHDNYLKNKYTGKCRPVLIVPLPKVFDEPINHPPRDIY